MESPRDEPAGSGDPNGASSQENNVDSASKQSKSKSKKSKETSSDSESEARSKQPIIRMRKQGNNQVTPEKSNDDRAPSSVTETPKKSKSPSKQSKNEVAAAVPVAKEVDIHHDEEELGDDFMSHPWIPPSIEKAKKFKEENIFRGGKAAFQSVTITEAADLSLGANLYFIFLRAMAIFMCVSSFLAIPSILFAYYGHGVAQQDQDAMGLYRFSLGNIGYNPSSPTYLTDARCHGKGMESYNGTCLHFENGMELTTDRAGYIISAMEILQIVVFFIIAAYLRKKASTLEESLSGLVCKVSDYSIIVRNLPPDTTADELIQHFNNLYPLDKPDWKNRPPLEGARTVKDIYNSGNPSCKNTWIAECIIHKEIGAMISAFRNQQHVMDELYKSRARMKMFAQGTTHADGYNAHAFEKAKQNVEYWTKKFSSLTNAVLSRNVKTNKVAPDADIENGKKVTGELIEANVVAGFVVFEYCESFARCLEDYNHYNRFPWYFCYPQTLLFKGRKLTIRKAPEPDEMVWENLEVGRATKWFRKGRTAVFTLILLLVCFIVILQSTIYKNHFNSKIPNLDVCRGDIPLLYANATSIPPGGLDFSDYKLTRPPTSLKKSYDSYCDAVIPGSFYAVYTYDGEWGNEVNSYNISSCAVNACPLQSMQKCPCIGTDIAGECSTLQCDADKHSRDCKSFKASTIGACFCMSELLGMLSSASVTDVMNKIKAEKDDNTCNTFFINYTSASAFSYLAIFVTVIVNKYLLKFLQILTKMESHASLDSEQGSLMFKIFVSTYFNMAILVLIASGKVENQPPYIRPAHVLQGSYTDFDASWYGNIGSYFLTTFIIQAVTPIATNMVSYFLKAPLLRLLFYPYLRKQKSHWIARQHDVNELEVGPTFDVTINQAQSLSLFFFAMTYAPGLPIIMPMASITFAVFFVVDKFFLLRYNRRPPKIGDGVMKIVISTLYYAAVLRMAIGCWMFGNPYILSPGFIDTGAAPVPTYSAPAGSFTDQMNTHIKILSDMTPNIAFVIKRIFRANVFFLFLLLILVVAITMAKHVIKNTPVFWLLGKILSCLTKSNKVHDVSQMSTNKGYLSPYHLQSLKDPNRQEMAPYTGEYYKFVLEEYMSSFLFFCFTPKQIDVNEHEMAEGWTIVYQGGRRLKVKQFREPTVTYGNTRKKFDRKFTFEVIQDHGCYSYAIEKIPSYAVALKGLREAAETLANINSAPSSPLTRAQTQRIDNDVNIVPTD